MSRHFLKHNLIASVAILALGIGMLAGCKTKDNCPEATNKVKAKVVSLSAPTNLKVGEKVAITIGMENLSGFCIRDTKANLSLIGQDTLLIEAELLRSGDKQVNDCECKEEDIIYTLIYFTPLTSGSYYLVLTPGSLTNLDPGDKTSFEIEVE